MNDCLWSCVWLYSFLTSVVKIGCDGLLYGVLKLQTKARAELQVSIFEWEQYCCQIIVVGSVYKRTHSECQSRTESGNIFNCSVPKPSET